MSDDLSRCLVNKSTEADRDAFMGWMFSAISADPRLNKLTTLDRAKRDELSFIAGSAMQRLLIVDCRKEAVATIKSEGFGAMEQSFSGLGRAATEQMFRSSEAQVELDALSKGLEDEKLKELGREAGIPEKQLQSADE